MYIFIFVYFQDVERLEEMNEDGHLRKILERFEVSGNKISKISFFFLRSKCFKKLNFLPKGLNFPTLNRILNVILICKPQAEICISLSLTLLPKWCCEFSYLFYRLHVKYKRLPS